jgi:FtsP/CotA-like multicopper oxidase with cupredoxin domain
MKTARARALSRREFMAAGAASALTTALPFRPARASVAHAYHLTPGPARVPLAGAPYPETDVWAYDGTVPGPEIRVRQGGRLRALVENRLAEETTVHWHGLRVPNAMDGVPHLTQAPIGPGESFVYEFDLPDAGTYWYHPHQRSFEQVGRGLYGPLIVEERDPIAVDRDLVWVLGDWRLLEDASISSDFGGRMETAMAGRIGNTVTVNGQVVDTFAVRAGERIRLRLINAAPARIFGLEFRGHDPRVIALDGHPVEPHAPEGDRVVLGPAMRADLTLDLTGRPGERFTVADTFYQGLEYRLLDLVYDAEPLRERPPDTPLVLSANTVPEPDLATAERHEVVLGGGMMGGMMGQGMRGMMSGRRTGMGGMMGMMDGGMAWTVNGVAALSHDMTPMLELQRGRSYVLVLANETAWWHPIHLHGHVFRVIMRDGVRTRHREWRDTVLLAPHERVEVAFVADNLGDWMLHCHVLEHQEGGMMAVVRVA